jgi:hypothetical protein
MGIYINIIVKLPNPNKGTRTKGNWHGRRGIDGGIF